MSKDTRRQGRGQIYPFSLIDVRDIRGCAYCGQMMVRGATPLDRKAFCDNTCASHYGGDMATARRAAKSMGLPAPTHLPLNAAPPPGQKF